MKQQFDLNIERVLENWDICHAVREIIANAIDEQTLTHSADIQIYQDQDHAWHIRDYGRGLEIKHFTQNENSEKQNTPGLIGKFGVGLKDALATFDRHHIAVKIFSAHGDFSTTHAKKHGFETISTLHAIITPPTNPKMSGTDFVLSNISDEDISKAKQFFLKFSKLQLLDTTKYGEVYTKRGECGEIFVNGIKIAEERNFLFSYNITTLTASLKKALNRERSNVGRSAYADRIKSILLATKSDVVADAFIENMDGMSDGLQSDELQWQDVQIHFANLLAKKDDVIFLTPDQARNLDGTNGEIIKNSEKRLVFVPESVLRHLKNVNTVKSVITDYQENYDYSFVPPSRLTASEQAVLKLSSQVIAKLHFDFSLKDIYISETMRPSDDDDDIRGVCEPDGRIIIKRSVLSSPTEFLGVLTHELIHAKTGLDDLTRDFETELTKYLGEALARSIN